MQCVLAKSRLSPDGSDRRWKSDAPAAAATSVRASPHRALRAPTLTREKRVHGFQTGDRVRAVVLKGKKAGTHVGRVAVRVTGSFNIQTPTGVVQGIAHRHCTTVQRADGYGYSTVPLTKERESGNGTKSRVG